MAQYDDAQTHLLTIRDFLRYAISRFQEAGLAYGHGASNALDEAAFIILEGLHLPIDKLEPFLDARLLPAERARLADLIDKRVTTRKPAAYLLGKAYIKGIPFHVDERVIVPRSFIGELLTESLFDEHGQGQLIDAENIETVLDLCTGSGALAIVAAHVLPHAHVDAVELSKDAMEVAKCNIADSEVGERIELLQGDLFAPVAGRRYDLIITNPPYVDAQAMAELPPEYRHEPVMALAGGEDGLDIVRRILREAGAHLNPGGGLLCEIGTGREILDEEFPGLPLLWLDTEESNGEVFWIGAADLMRSAGSPSGKT